MVPDVVHADSVNCPQHDIATSHIYDTLCSPATSHIYDTLCSPATPKCKVLLVFFCNLMNANNVILRKALDLHSETNLCSVLQGPTAEKLKFTVQSSMGSYSIQENILQALLADLFNYQCNRSTAGIRSSIVA